MDISSPTTSTPVEGIAAHRVCPNCGETVAPESHRGAFCSICRFPLAVLKNTYRLDSVIAEGGFGVVYLATTNTDEQCVVKIVKPEVFNLEGMERRFHREVRITQELSQLSPHIIQVFDHDSDKYLGHYYVMEYLQGMHLGKLLRKQRLNSLTDTFHVFRQLCEALIVSHSNGVIHRDLKPENVFVLYAHGDPLFVKLLDFGIAKPMDATTRASLTQGVLGTPFYMPPEQFMNEAVDARSDIYSLGVMLYEMLSGKLPFGEGNMSVLMFRHMAEDPTPLQELRPDLSPLLCHAVMKAMAKKPIQRHQTVLEFWEALESFAASEGEAISPEVQELAFQTTLLPNTPTPEPVPKLPVSDPNDPLLSNRGRRHSPIKGTVRLDAPPRLSPPMGERMPHSEMERPLRRPTPAPQNSSKNTFTFLILLFVGLLFGSGGVAWYYRSLLQKANDKQASQYFAKLKQRNNPVRNAAPRSKQGNKNSTKNKPKQPEPRPVLPQATKSPSKSDTTDDDDDSDDDDEDSDDTKPSPRRTHRKRRRRIRRRIRRRRRRKRLRRKPTVRKATPAKKVEPKVKAKPHRCGTLPDKFRWVEGKLIKPRGFKASFEFGGCSGCSSKRKFGGYCLKVPKGKTISLRVSAQGHVACTHRLHSKVKRLRWSLVEATADSLIDENYRCLK